MESPSRDDSKVSTGEVLMTLEWQLEAKKKRKKEGEQGAKRKSCALTGEELCFKSRIFLGCEMIALKTCSNGGGGSSGSDLGKISLCISFHYVRKFVLMSEHRDTD